MFGGGDPARAIPMHYLNEESWEAALILPQGTAPDEEIQYIYFVRNPDGSAEADWAGGRCINFAKLAHAENVVVDAWNPPGQFENALYTEPFNSVLLKPRHGTYSADQPAVATHTFRIKAPLLEKNQTICLLGDGPALRQWDTANPILLNRSSDSDYLSVRLDLSRFQGPLNYKYGVVDFEAKQFVRYEEGENRYFHDAQAPHKHTIINDGFVRLPANTWRGIGVAIPVFSLRSERGFGVGEFADLKPFGDWARNAGLKLIQILPVNDTTSTHSWLDSYPYSAISAFALHPQYLNLDEMTAPKQKALLKDLEPERQRLNALDALDYEGVMKAKESHIRRIFPLQRQATFRSREYKTFFTQNQDWLGPYAVFCCLRDRYGTADFNRWPDHRKYEAGAAARMEAEGSPDRDAIELTYFVQFHLHSQLQDAVKHLHSQGIILKGDIAIGVNRFGADTWQQPELYRMEMQAGAPPDPFGAKGQNWSFPTYRWERMKQDGFAWWKRRFAQMSAYFDAFRIDHILGFFRIWSVPLDAVEGILGYFVPALPVQPAEFAARGIEFDRQRYTKPFITDAVLGEMFGGAANDVKREFLVENRIGQFDLKDAFATQRKIETEFAKREDSESNRKLKAGLFDLVSNVILLEEPAKDGSRFHFRFSIDSAPSFQHLPEHTKGALREMYIDYFFRRQEEFWRREALEKLPALKRETNMLVCGEDLGLVPACVPQVMSQLGLLSLEVQRMPKAMGIEFFNPANAPYLSVVTPSSHDMSTIRGWWEEDRGVTQRFYSGELGQQGEAPQECEPWINELVVRQHLGSPAMWSIFQVQDLMGIDGQLRRKDVGAERINVPANPKNFWKYRMHVTVESLMERNAFTGKLATLAHNHGR